MFLLAMQPILMSFAEAASYRIPYKPDTDVPELTLTPNPVYFEDTAVGQVGRYQATLTNTGATNATGISLSTQAPFNVDATCEQLSPGQSCPVFLAFSPSVTGPASQLLAMSTSQGSQNSARLVASGAPLLSGVELTDDGWNFGYWNLHEQSDTKTLGIKNNGELPVVITQLFLVEGKSVFNLVLNCGAQLTTGENCTVSVRYTPDSLGEHIGAFRIKRADGAAHLYADIEYNPIERGVHEAVVTYKHNTSDLGETSFNLRAETERDVVATLEGPAGEALTDQFEFPKQAVGYGSAVKRVVYLRANGTRGRVNYEKLTLSGSPNLRVTRVGLVQKGTNRFESKAISLTRRTELIALNRIGDSVATSLDTDLGVEVEFLPTNEGVDVATITIAHNGNEQGFTTFDVVGHYEYGQSLTVSDAIPPILATEPIVSLRTLEGVPVGGEPLIKRVYFAVFGFDRVAEISAIQIEGDEHNQFSVIQTGRAGMLYNSSLGQCVSGASAVSFTKRSNDEYLLRLKADKVPAVLRDGCPYTNYQHLYVDIAFTPKVEGATSATFKYTHNSSALGVDSFQLNAEAIPPVLD